MNDVSNDVLQANLAQEEHGGSLQLQVSHSRRNLTPSPCHNSPDRLVELRRRGPSGEGCHVHRRERRVLGGERDEPRGNRSQVGPSARRKGVVVARPS